MNIDLKFSSPTARACHRWLPLQAVVAAALLALLACGGGGGGNGNPSSTDDPVLPAAKAWTGALPAQAASMPYDEFRAAVAAGRLTLAGPAVNDEQALARQQQFDADKATLTAAAVQNPVLRHIVDEAAQSSNPMVDPVIDVMGGESAAALLGRASTLRLLAETHERLQSADNLRAAYAQSYALAPQAVQRVLPSPASLAGLTAQAVSAALTDLDARLSALPPAAQTPTRLSGNDQPAGPGAPTGRARALSLQAGQGSDADGANCSSTNLAAFNWYPLRSFLNPARSQGMRNTCWAFAAVGALEIRERVQADRTVNLSEQFLVNQTRHKWFVNDTVETGSATSALEAALGARQVIPDESVWTYNRSLSRDSTLATFNGACINYGTGANAGSCSQTAHQSPSLKCSGRDTFTFCGYERIDYAGPGVTSSLVATRWKATYVDLLNNGVPLIAAMPVYDGFRSIDRNASSLARGVLTDTATGVNRGDHVVLIVGFLSNAQLSRPGTVADIPGGGYFIVRNSWGCGFGDAGYAYVSADYVKNNFRSLESLYTSDVRSASWQAEQALPGGAIAPAISVTGGGIVAADLNVSTDLSAFFKVSHPVAKGVHVLVTSNVDGVLFDGNWNTDPDALIGQIANHTFKVRGTREVTLQARYGSQTSERVIVINVINNPPTVRLQGSGVATLGEDYSIAALVSDRNENDATALCARTQWSVAAPDTLSGNSGCSQLVRFGAMGPRTITVTTTDAEGWSVSTTLTANVQAAPANPYPRITGARVFSRELAGASPFRFCGTAPVADGQTIDLRETGCKLLVTDTAPTRFGANVDVENPSNEPLVFEWNLYVMHDNVEGNVYGGHIFPSGSAVSLNSPGNQSLVTYSCRLELKVRVPQPERDKSRTVWSGLCTYIAGTLR
jgi:C1A family cysteine protease